MAHFAKITEDNTVENVIVIPDSEEETGEQFIKEVLGLDGTWLQCSYTNRIRGIFPYIGGKYDPEKDEFLPIFMEVTEEVVTLDPKYIPSVEVIGD